MRMTGGLCQAILSIRGKLGKLVTLRGKIGGCKISAEAKYSVLTNVASDLIGNKILLSKMVISFKMTMELYCDHKITIHISIVHVQNDGTEHIDVD